MKPIILDCTTEDKIVLKIELETALEAIDYCIEQKVGQILKPIILDCTTEDKIVLKIEFETALEAIDYCIEQKLPVSIKLGDVEI